MRRNPRACLGVYEIRETRGSKASAVNVDIDVDDDGGDGDSAGAEGVFTRHCFMCACECVTVWRVESEGWSFSLLVKARYSLTSYRGGEFRGVGGRGEERLGGMPSAT